MSEKTDGKRLSPNNEKCPLLASRRFNRMLSNHGRIQRPVVGKCTWDIYGETQVRYHGERATRGYVVHQPLGISGIGQTDPIYRKTERYTRRVRYGHHKSR